MFPGCTCGTGTGLDSSLRPPSRLALLPFSLGVSRLDPDEEELAILALLPVVEAFEVGSVSDLALSRFDFCRNLGSLETGPDGVVGGARCVGIGDDAEGGIRALDVLFDMISGKMLLCGAST